ncbi:MAG: hypothetical protein CVU39_17600 [Chloroflexi bacterium HGW-Chloroflexi-10]|nr:MAG: hypothetical protein CVU39_17600 [Chloroflexi bacterium HGW-Chloroflexi-10]
MPKIVIITDTDSSLPVDLAQKHHITQVPITIHFGEETYTTGVDINDQKLFEIVDHRKILPTTSAPPPNAFVNAYKEAFENGAETIICICVSSKISATFNAAEAACELFPDKDIVVIDALNLCMAQGFMALAAAEAVEKGASKQEVIQAVEDIQKRVHVFGALPTLKYLAMGGRMGKLAAGLADTLNIKPILTARNGKLELLEKVRTSKKAEQRLLELAVLSTQGKKIERIAMIHVNNQAGVEKLYQQLCEMIPCPPHPILADFTPGLSVHAGSGVIGFVILTD